MRIKKAEGARAEVRHAEQVEIFHGIRKEVPGLNDARQVLRLPVITAA